MSEVKRVREMEELIGLQATAIQALQQAAQALQIALQALEKAMADKGDQQKIVFVPQPNPLGNIPYNPTPYQYTPYIGDAPNWGGDSGLTGTWINTSESGLNSAIGGLCATVMNTSKAVNSLVHNCAEWPIGSTK
jgi:type II secretory pathway pseudopilin PulG